MHMKSTGSLQLTSGGALEGAATARCHGFAGLKLSSSDSKPGVRQVNVH